MNGNDKEMKELEDALRVALWPVDAPNGFTDSVMDRARLNGNVRHFPARQAWIGSLAASLLLAALSFGGLEHRRAQERMKAESDFARSQEITNEAMKMTREKLQTAGVLVD